MQTIRHDWSGESAGTEDQNACANGRGGLSCESVERRHVLKPMCFPYLPFPSIGAGRWSTKTSQNICFIYINKFYGCSSNICFIFKYQILRYFTKYSSFSKIGRKLLGLSEISNILEKNMLLHVYFFINCKNMLLYVFLVFFLQIFDKIYYI